MSLYRVFGLRPRGLPALQEFGQHEDPQGAGKIPCPAMRVDLRHQRLEAQAPRNGYGFQLTPKGIFQGNAGAVTVYGDRALLHRL